MKLPLGDLCETPRESQLVGQKRGGKRPLNGLQRADKQDDVETATLF